MRKFIKFLGIGLLAVVLGALILGWAMDEPLPQGVSGPEADALAKRMLVALNGDAYKNTRYLEWSFQGGKNQYVWDKQLGKVTVKWKNFKVNLSLSDPMAGMALEDGKSLEGVQKKEVLQQALDMFNNDSFWLVAPYKVFDKGTQRSLVKLENGDSTLLVTYTQGGSTPGDSYLWLFDDTGLPKAYKMWVKIIPIGGLQASWDDWTVTESGAFLPKSHKMGPITISMGTVQGYH